MTKTEATLSLVKISKSYKNNGKSNEIFSKVSLSFETGKSYAIVGASGVGKSSLLAIIGMLSKPTSGKVVSTANPKEKNLFGYVFQDHHLIEELTVLENILLAGSIKNMDEQTAEKTAKKLLKDLSLQKISQHFPNQLSGGQKQMVSILRALICRPQFLLADEPTGNLDKDSAQKVIDTLCNYQKDFDMGLIICSHDPVVFNQLEQIIRLKNGSVEMEPKAQKT